MKKLLIISLLFILVKINYSGEWKSYSSPVFSISYPEAFILDTSYSYKQLSKGKEIKGVSFTIPASFMEGTNLIDAYISVEWLPYSADCNAKNFEYNTSFDSTAKENGVYYTIAYYSEGAMGSIYEETVYSRISEVYCYGIRLFIHSTRVDSYEPGTVKEFDRAALEEIFRKMRDSLKIIKQ